MIKWTKEKIIDYINKIDKYIFIDFIQYNGLYSIIKVKCNKNAEHGEFVTNFSNIKNNEQRNSKNGCCEKCKKEMLSNKFKLDYDTIKRNIEIEGYKLISKDYKNSKTKLEIKCPNCKNTFMMTYSNFHTNKQRCPKCGREKQYKNQKLTYKYIKNEIEKDKKYILLSKEYNGCWEDLKIKCLTHNFIFYKNWHEFQQGKRCPKCSNEQRIEKQKHSYSYIKDYVNSHGDELLSTKYINNKSRLKIKCKEGHIFFRNFDNYKSSQGCPICNKNTSKGEKKLNEILDKYNIKYITQYKFKDCRFKKVLPFDFYLPEYNILIEYDGLQHFEIREHFGGYESFIDTKIRDTIKNIYCEDNNIELLRIPYWEFNNIENIIINKLNLD